MQIESVRAVPGVSGFYFDDQRAIKAGASEDGFGYAGDPVTDGFDAVRQAGEAVLVTVTLSDGTVVRGDCTAVQYSGAGGRDPLFRAADYAPVVEERVADELVGRDPSAFLDNVAAIAAVPSQRSEGERLHTAVRYGVSQALLFAAAHARRRTPTTVLADELDVQPATSPVPVFGQSGDDRHRNAEKMLLKGVRILPHGLFNSAEKLGADGEGLVAYLRWLSERARELGPADAKHRFHVDVYGMIGELFGPPYDRPELCRYVDTLRAAAAPFPLQVEGPIDAGGRAEQIEAMTELREGLAAAAIDVDIVADEWCNTLDDVRAFVDAGAADVVQVKTPDLGGLQQSVRAVTACQGTETRAYVGGTCNETAVSARACAHVALATDAAQLLAKPGMGFDEGYMTVTNEMRRTLARRERERQEVAVDD